MNGEKRFAPYGPPGTIIRIIRNFRDRDVPEEIGPEVLSQLGVSEGLMNRVLQSLEFLGLIMEDGTTTNEFRSFPTKTDEEYRELLGSLVRGAYGGVFRVMNVEQVSDQELFNAFRPYSPAGQRSRMLTLFRGLCREAGIPVAGGGEAPPATTPVRRKRDSAPPRASERQEGESRRITPSPNGLQQRAEAPFQTLIGILNPERMSEEEQDAVWTLIRYLKKQETLQENSGGGAERARHPV